VALSECRCMNMLRIWKTDCAMIKSVLAGESFRHAAAVARKAPCRACFRQAAVDVTRKSSPQAVVTAIGKRRPVAGLARVKCRSDPPHFPGYREIANPHLAHIAIHIAAELIEQQLSQVTACHIGLLEV